MPARRRRREWLRYEHWWLPDARHHLRRVGHGPGGVDDVVDDHDMPPETEPANSSASETLWRTGSLRL